MMNTSNKKIIVLEKMPEAKFVLQDSGKREQNNNQFFSVPLNAIQTENSLWMMRYNPPARLPPTLQGLQFTTFSALKKFAEAYFNKRNIKIKEIVEVKDEPV